MCRRESIVHFLNPYIDHARRCSRHSIRGPKRKVRNRDVVVALWLVRVIQPTFEFPIAPRSSSPGMPEMLSPGAALVGAGLGKSVALVTDGRFSGASHGRSRTLLVL